MAIKTQYIYITKRGALKHTEQRYKIPKQYSKYYICEVLDYDAERMAPNIIPLRAYIEPNHICVIDHPVNIRSGELIALRESYANILTQLYKNDAKFDEGQQTLRKTAGLKSFMDKNSVKTSNIVSGLNRVIGK